MNKQLTALALVAVAATMFVVAAQAQNTTGTNATSTALARPLIAAGVAVSTSDNSVFQPVSVMIVQPHDFNSNVSTTPKGVFRFDGQKYDLANIAATNTSVTADAQTNGTTVGSFSLSAAAQAGHWVGTLSLNGTSYNLYVISARGAFFEKERMEEQAEMMRHRGWTMIQNGNNMTQRADEIENETSGGMHMSAHMGITKDKGNNGHD